MSKKNRIAKRLWLALFLDFAMVAVSQADYVINNLPERIQEHSNWSWDATSQSILNYYEQTWSSKGYGPWSDSASFKQNAGGTPKIDSPAPGSTLSGSTEIFTWSANGASVTKWWL
jgi:hypothetical protein